MFRGNLTKKFLMLLSLLLSGCAVSGTQVFSETTDSNTTDAAAFRLPLPSQVRQSAETPTSPFRYGNQYETDLPLYGLTEYGTTTYFHPNDENGIADQDLAFAMYRLHLPDYAHQPVVKTEGDISGNKWIGFANYERDRWDWQKLNLLGSFSEYNTFNPEFHVQNEELLIAIVTGRSGYIRWLVAGDTTKPYILDVVPKVMVTGSEVQFVPTLKYSLGDLYVWDFGEGTTPWLSTEASPVVTALEPGTYDCSLTVGNVLGTDTYEFTYQVFEVSEIDPMYLLAIPDKTDVSVNEEVIVTVKCGDFPIQEQMHTCTITLLVSEHASYVPNSFNIGAPGGAKLDIDGLWADFDNPPDDWLLGYDEWIAPAATETPGLSRMEIPLVPLLGGSTTTGGDIANVTITFSQPGVYELNFEPDTEYWIHTWYRIKNGATLNWYDISNDAAPAIVVTE